MVKTLCMPQTTATQLLRSPRRGSWFKSLREISASKCGLSCFLPDTTKLQARARSPPPPKKLSQYFDKVVHNFPQILTFLLTLTDHPPQQCRPRPPCIPGLVSQAFVRGSRHKAASCPVLKTSRVNQESGECLFQWEAAGSSGTGWYLIEAIGTFQLDLADNDRGNPIGRGLKVTCTCPDGERQAATALSTNEIVVCKHGAAAMESVLDDEARAQYESTLARKRQQRQEARALKRQQEEQAKYEQDRDMPGERVRIEYGLKALSREDVHQMLTESCKTVEGLRALGTIFPKSIMPAPQTKYCIRCEKKYDERYSEEKVCRMEHPYEFCHTQWDGSKISWQKCYRCDQDFDVPDHHKKGPYDAGEFCFEGEHTQDEDLVTEENWNANPSDLAY